MLKDTGDIWMTANLARNRIMAALAILSNVLFVISCESDAQTEDDSMHMRPKECRNDNNDMPNDNHMTSSVELELGPKKAIIVSESKTDETTRETVAQMLEAVSSRDPIVRQLATDLCVPASQIRISYTMGKTVLRRLRRADDFLKMLDEYSGTAHAKTKQGAYRLNVRRGKVVGIERLDGEE
jgi:hypothetical protein